jgi:hypothetical protein
MGGESNLNDYTEGCLEALAYVKVVVEEMRADTGARSDKLGKVIQKIDYLKEEILRGTTHDFVGRARALSRY